MLGVRPTAQAVVEKARRGMTAIKRKVMEETIVHVVVTNLGTTEIEMEDLEEPVLEELWISVWTTVQWTPLKFLDLVSQCAPSDACKISFKELYSKKKTHITGFSV